MLIHTHASPLVVIFWFFGAGARLVRVERVCVILHRLMRACNIFPIPRGENGNGNADDPGSSTAPFSAGQFEYYNENGNVCIPCCHNEHTNTEQRKAQ